MPTPISGACVWNGRDLADDPRWRFSLNAADIAEIDRAAEAAGRMPWREMTRTDFPLERLAVKLARISVELENGCGMALLSGLPVERYGARLRHVWYGIGLHLGQPVHQDCQGLQMRDLQDVRADTDARHGHQMQALDGSTFKSSKARALSKGELRFHTDRCDVVGLLCVRQASAGGINRLASSARVHNVMLTRHPDLTALLYRPYHRSRLGEEAGGEHLSYALPVFGQRDGKFTSHYSRTYIEAAQETPYIPRMSSRQWEALDRLHDVAAEVCLESRLRPGDMQFLNNHVIYHARSAFEDDPAGPGRLLHRLWLTTPNNRALPDDHDVLWGRTGAGEPRGGIRQAVQFEGEIHDSQGTEGQRQLRP